MQNQPTLSEEVPPLVQGSIGLLLRLRNHALIVDIHVVRLDTLESTKEKFSRLVIVRGEAIKSWGARCNGFGHALAKVQGPRTSNGQPSSTRRPLCNRVLLAIPTSRVVGGMRLKKSESHSGINMSWKQSLMSVMPNQAVGIASGSTSNFEKPSLERSCTL